MSLFIEIIISIGITIFLRKKIGIPKKRGITTFFRKNQSLFYIFSHFFFLKKKRKNPKPMWIFQITQVLHCSRGLEPK
jgi:hypothetical protein